MDYDYVKGYKAPLESLPKEIRDIVTEKLTNKAGMIGISKEELNEYMLHVDLYITVDINNYYKK